MAVSLTTNVAALSTLLAARTAGASVATGASSARSEASTTSGVTVSANPKSTADVAADAVDQATSVLDTASAAGATISDTLVQIRRAVTAAASPAVDPAQRDALTSGFQSLIAQLQTAVSSGSFGGANLLDGSSEPSGLSFDTGGDAGAVTLHGADLSPGGSIITISAATDLSTPQAARAALSGVDLSTAAAKASLTAIKAQSQDVSSASTTAANGPVTDTDAASLLALQVRQLLSSAPGALASVSSQSILRLFKG